MENQEKINPLLCNPETGVCEIPANATNTVSVQEINAVKPIHVTYFTDPICSSCWGIEPQLRKLKLEYGEYIHIDYKMGGLLPDWSYNSGGISKPSDVAHHWDEVSAYYDMPIDGDVWLEDPLNSSYPPSIAFKAAQMQDETKAIAFLRKLREMVFLKKKNITRWEHIQRAANDVQLDTVKLKNDYEGKAQDLFKQDLADAKAMGVRGFPTLFFTGKNGAPLKIYGFKPYDEFENTVQKLLPTATKKAIDTSLVDIMKTYATLTVKEYMILANVSRAVAQQQLDALVETKNAVKITCKNGSLWERSK